MQRFRRSLWGYAEKDVDATMAYIRQGHNDEMQFLKKELAEEVRLFETRRENLTLLDKAMRAYGEQEEIIRRSLMEAYLGAMQRIVDARRNAEQTEDAMKQKLQAMEDEMTKRQQDATRIRMDLEILAGKYVPGDDAGR